MNTPGSPLIHCVIVAGIMRRASIAAAIAAIAFVYSASRGAAGLGRSPG